MPAMSQQRPDAPSPSAHAISERTAEAYRERLVLKLEGENARLRDHADELQRRLDERTSELRAFGMAAQAVQGVRRVISEPALLAKVPAAALRVARGGELSTRDAHRSRRVPPPARRTAGIAAHRIETLRDPSSLAVALVADEPLARALGPECRVIAISPGDWQATLEADRPDLLLVESAWRANGGAWQYRIAWYGHPISIGLPDLRALTGWCSANRVPSVFWDTAGPVARGRFDEAASLFDVILSADPAGLAYYDSLSTRRAAIIDLLEPGVQLRSHHPGPEDDLLADVAGGERGGPVFVGSYDQTRSLADREALERLLDAALARGLVIRDTAGVAGPDFAGFPDQFQAAIRPFSATDDVPDVLRRADVALVDAPGGDADLVPAALLEALACGAPVVSTPSRAIRERFGAQVPGASIEDDPAAALDAILADPREARRRIRREVLPGIVGSDRIASRLGRLAAAAGIALKVPAATVGLAVLHDDPRRTGLLLAELSELSGVSEFLIGTSDWPGAGRALAAGLRAARPLTPVRIVEQPTGAGASLRLERLAGATEVDWIAAWSSPPGLSRTHVDPASPSDLVERLTVEIVLTTGDRVPGIDPRLPVAVRREAILAAGWPADGATAPAGKGRAG